jgi:transposase-like protein
MPRKRYNAEEIIHKLREADVHFSQGRSVKQVSNQLGIAEQTYYRWRKAYGSTDCAGPPVGRGAGLSLFGRCLAVPLVSFSNAVF